MKSPGIHFFIVGLFCTIGLLAQTDTFDTGHYKFQMDNTYAHLDTTEWKKLKDFQTRLETSKASKVEKAQRFKSYTRDSIKILEVKLLAIKLLEERELLDQDIAENPQYYLSLLERLKESGLDHSEYRFLEHKMAYLTLEEVERKFQWSMALNIILGVLILGIGAFLLFGKRGKQVLPGLSRQERVIQALILQGKSNKEIANELFISVSTVKTHITNLYGKLHVANRGELLQKAQNQARY